MDKTKVVTTAIVCFSVVLVVGVLAAASVLVSRNESDAERIRATQQIEHDKTRPRKAWEKDPAKE